MRRCFVTERKIKVAARGFFRPAAVIAAIAVAPLLFAQGLLYEPPVIDGHEPPFQTTKGAFSDAFPAILKNNGTMFKDTALIDFEKRQLTFSRQDKDGNSVWSYHYGELNDYIADRKAHSFYEDWYNKLTEQVKKELGAPPVPRLQWELAVHYPPWAQRLLGNDPPRLKIEGRLELIAATDYTRIVVDKDTTTDLIPLDLDTKYSFAIHGSVGRLINVNITHSREDGFDLGADPLKNFKVEYKESYAGELEDEIIQEIVAGYTGFDMPGTNLSGYSEKHDGLFGIKARAKFGPLMLTTVLSHAQGEAITKELGGKNDPNSMTAVRDNDFIKNRYFFLDNAYKEYYNKVNSINNPERNATKPPQVREFQAFVSIGCGEVALSTVRRYKANMNGSEVCFKMLTENQDYTVDVDRGWVRFEYSVKESEIVAVAMTTTNASFNRGTMVPINAGNDSHQDLWMLKPNNLDDLTDANEPAFGLMWRNVYYLPELEDAKLDLFFLDPARGDTIRHVGNELLSKVMGLTDEQGRARVENVEIFKIDKQELVIPPFSPTERGGEPFSNPALGDMASDMIYRLGARTTAMRDYVAKFGILTNGLMRRSTYDDLGWSILSGTVIVKTNSGVLLVEGEDYDLDYEMGIIDLISTRARSAESIFITYQRESDFVLEKKVFAGLRGEMRLPFISDHSFMAASFLYQSAATSAGDIPQLGNEPFSKMHLSFNTSLDFQPEWMTKAANAITRGESETESSAKLDFEVVHSRMNPNTSKEKGSYIDDFERTKDGYTVSMRHPSWHASHYPFKYTGGAQAIADSMLANLRIPPWEFYWYTPNAYDDTRRISRQSVWAKDPNNSRYSSSDTYIDVLRLHVTQASLEHPVHVRERFKNTYASITTSFGRNGINMENHRYLELVVNPKGTGNAMLRKGKLMIQIGTFSHDQVRDGGPPNGKFDLEDPTYQNKPEMLSVYDKGLNGLDVSEKFYVIPNEARTGWDTLSRQQNADLLVAPRSFDNPSGDLFRKYDKDNLTTFKSVNGTWNNSRYDDENIDVDGIPRIGIVETYYTYEINLDNDASRYIDKTSRVVESNGWRFYRIPLKDVLDGVSVVKDSALGGAPNMAKVRGMRLVWYDFDNNALISDNELQIAGIELSGSYWEPSVGSEDKIEPTSISNYEDITYYNSVYDLIVKPKSGEVTPEERSLRLNFFGLSSGDTATVRKNLTYNAQNIAAYDSVSVMVYATKSYGDELKYIFRFGSDDSTYYEYSAPLDNGIGWSRFAFSLQDLSDLKLSADTVENKPINASMGRLRVVAPANKRPNFTAITFMATGVARTGGGPIDGEIWVNELIATGGRVLNGLAARINLTTQWSDFFTLGAGISYTDGDFRTMTDVALGGSDRSELTANLNAVLKLDKFMPEEWGVSIPVGGSLSGALSRPTVKPQSDIKLLDDGTPDGFLDMVGDAFSMLVGGDAQGEQTRSQRFETFSSTRNAYTSFAKESESENPFVAFTLDRIKTDISYNRTSSYTGKGPHEHPDSADYIRTDTTVTYTGALRYDLSPRNPPAWTSYTPFEDVKWLPPIHRKYTLNLLPSTIDFDLAEVQHRTEKRDDHKLNVYDFTTRMFDMRHGVRLEYSPIAPLLSFSYSARLDRDLSNLPTRNDWDLMMDSTFANIFGLNTAEDEKWDEYGILYGERGRTQSASAKLAPQFVTWMTHSAEYSADYTGLTARRDNDSARYINADVSTSLRFRNSLMLSDLFKFDKYKVAAKPAAKDTANARDTAKAKDSLANSARSGGAWAFIGRNVSKINMRSINFEYDVSTDLKNGFLSSTYLADTAHMSQYEFFKYQLGMRRGLNDYLFGSLGDDVLGGMQYRFLTGAENDLYRNDQSKGTWAARVSTAFSIPGPLKVDFSGVSVGWGREFYGQPDTAYIDTVVVLPEVRASASTKALTSFAFVKKYFSDLGVSSSASYKKSRKEAKDRSDSTTALELQPLVSVEGKFIKWPSLTANYRFGATNVNVSTGGKGADTGSVGRLSTENTNRNSHTFTMAYAFTGAGRLKEIRVRKWVIPVQGKASMGLGVNWETSEVRTSKIGDEEDGVVTESNFNYSPYVDYTFTKNIKGRARYLGSHRNQNGKLTLNQRFELTAEVTF